MLDEINTTDNHERLSELLGALSTEELRKQFYRDGVYFFKNNQGNSIGATTHNLSVNLINAKTELVTSMDNFKTQVGLEAEHLTTSIHDARISIESASGGSTKVAHKLNVLTGLLAILMIITIAVSSFSVFVQYKQYKLNEYNSNNEPSSSILRSTTPDFEGNPLIQMNPSDQE